MNLYREKRLVEKYIRKIETIDKLSDQDRQEELEQIRRMRNEISIRFKKGKLSERYYKRALNFGM